MREEFEAWHHAEFGYCVPEEEDPLAIGECVKRWRIWQASRAALRVELPPEFNAGDLFEDTPIYNASMIKVILQQAGIEVKQNG
ncbi:hypothetical protein APB52_20180 [Pseudomonas aeruginosa]|uniref:hypothetical protein n=1 Tax=Pseudomonas aeruginosa TaxID=287 RepID=UPI00071B0030|nr:hypothetical protein [Pseudomonas aeruginosa]KSR90803.1 hypothetical protein APB52_20180 [Pseudomonas aeruginosa]